MLGGLLGLGLDVEIAGIPDGPGVIHRQTHQAGHVVLFQRHVGVQQGLIPLAAAPEHVSLAAQAGGDFHRLLDLRRRESEHVGVGRGARPVHVPRIVEAVGRTPQHLFAALAHQLGQQVGDFVQPGVGFLQGGGLRGDVPIVEAEIIDVQLIHQLEGRVSLGAVNGHGIALAEILDKGAAPEHVGAVAAQGMPVGQGEFQLLAHGLARHDLLRVVIPEGQGIGAFRALVGHLGDAGKIGVHVGLLP